MSSPRGSAGPPHPDTPPNTARPLGAASGACACPETLAGRAQSASPRSWTARPHLPGREQGQGTRKLRSQVLGRRLRRDQRWSSEATVCRGVCGTLSSLYWDPVILDGGGQRYQPKPSRFPERIPLSGYLRPFRVILRWFPLPGIESPLMSEQQRPATTEAPIFTPSPEDRTGFPVAVWGVAALIVLVVIGVLVVAGRKKPVVAPNTLLPWTPTPQPSRSPSSP